MSTASLNVLKGLISRGKADLGTVDTWETKKLLTPEEAEQARAYWRELNDPPAPEPTPESASPTEEPTD